MENIYTALVMLALVEVWFMLWSDNNEAEAEHDWWDYVSEAVDREKARAPFEFRIIGPQTGRWIDMGITDTRQSGYTFHDPDDPSKGGWS